jgi:hypothetical protein
MKPTPTGGFLRWSTLADVALALIVCAIAAAVYLSHYGVGNALSSDNVMPYVMFDDLFRRHVGLDGFLWPESPFYFPDTLLAWAIYALVGSLTGAVTAYAWINSTIFVLLVRAVLIRAAIGPDSRVRATWLTFLGLWLVVGMLGVAGGLGWFGQFYAYVFVPLNHSGTLLGVLAGMALLFGEKDRAGRSSIFLLIALCIGMLLSDRLFEIQFMLPAIAYCVFRCVASQTRWHGQALLILLALLVGAEALRWLFPSDTMRWVAALSGSEQGFQVGGDPNMRIPPADSLARMLTGFGELIRADVATSIIELACVVATLWVLAAAFRVRDRTAGTSNQAILVAFIGATALAPMLASIFLGRHIAIHAFRYEQTIALLPLPLAMLVAAAFWQRQRLVVAMYAAVALLALLAPVFIDASRSALYANEREQERCLHDLAAKKQLKFGVAEFWHALEMTARFPDAPVIAPLSTDAGPRMSMVTNMGWFGAIANRPDAIPTLDFVDEYSYTPALLDEVFGKPSETVACPRSAYRVYLPADGALAHLYRHFEWMPGQILQRLGRIAMPAAAWAADEVFVEGDAIHANGSLAPSTPVLITAQDFPAGRIQAWLAYSFTAREAGASVRWDITALDANGNALVPVGQGSLPASSAVTQIDLPLAARPQNSPGLGISVTVSGGVDLRIIAIGIRIGKRQVGPDAGAAIIR